MTFLTGTGRHRVQIAHFFRGQIGSWRSLEVGLVVGSRLHRIAPVLGALQRALDPKPGRLGLWPDVWLRELPYISTDGSDRAWSVGRLHMSSTTLSDLRETSGPRIDRIPPTRPPRRDRQYRELKKLFFSPPSKCAIDLLGPLANGTILKRLHVVPLLASVLQGR